MLALCAACGGPKADVQVDTPRPVTVVELTETDPAQRLLLTGSVTAWKEEQVAFEVAGTVSFVCEPSTFLQGRWLENGEARVEGDLLARLDTREYEIALEQAKAEVEVARERIATAKVQLEQVLPANRDAAMANRDRAEAEYSRYREAAASRAVSEVEVIRAKGDRDAMVANYAQTVAAIATKRAEIKSLEASYERAVQHRARAEFDLERCQLRAPFSGEVSEVYIEAGGYANRGEPVANLVMMSPIKVDLAVSRQTLGRLRRGDAVRLFVPGSEEPVPGRVYEKGTVADPKTRTFRVSIITPNGRLRGSYAEDDPRSGMPRVELTMPLVRATLEPCEGMLYAEERRALRKDDQGFFVWADPKYTASDSIPDGTVLHARKFRVVPGEMRANLQGIYLIRELKDVGELPVGTLLVLDVPATDKDEIQLLLTRPQWLLRPGQLIDVLFAGKAPQPGLYLPLDAIRPRGGREGYVFLAREGKARKVRVTIVGQVGSMARVEADAAELHAGDSVIVDYVHFLQDGEPVRVIKKSDR